MEDKKRGGKFQPFKKLFGKKKKKGTLLFREESAGRQSHSPQSASNGTFSSDEETLENDLSDSWARTSSLGNGRLTSFP